MWQTSCGLQSCTCLVDTRTIQKLVAEVRAEMLWMPLKSVFLPFSQASIDLMHALNMGCYAFYPMSTEDRE